MSISSLPRWVYTFIPNKDVKVTPIILSANVIIWLIMIATGVSPLMPGTEDVLSWGATSADKVTDGDYWRLWTSNYLHYGIIHLAVNMLSLNNIGRMLEQFIGWWRFALLYTFTGICGSAASIWWNPYAVGVGASGAILGIVGVLLALLTTNLIEKTVRMKMLRSMAISAGLMILIGLQANVDNAAHLGGLGAGMIGGYFIFPELRAHYYQRKKQFLGLIAALLLISGGIGWFVLNAQQFGNRTPQQISTDFETNLNTVLNNLDEGKYTEATEIRSEVIPVFEDGLRKLDTINSFDINPENKELNDRTRIYIQSMIRHFDYLAKFKETSNTAYSDSAISWKTKSDTAFARIYQAD